jgi:hypothetical protein
VLVASLQTPPEANDAGDDGEWLAHRAIRRRTGVKVRAHFATAAQGRKRILSRSTVKVRG